jgi:NTE family protein
MTKKALVLSGGGAVGIAWESGLIGGLAKAGVDLSDADFILGTSAGSFVGARLAMGQSPEEIAAPFLKMDEAPPKPASGGQAAPRPRELAPLMAKMQEIAAGDRSPQEVRAELGAFALTASDMSEEAFIQSFGRAFAGVPEDGWPQRAFACTAVDCADGSFQLWDAASGVNLARAVASSCAVPGVFPPITLKGRRYMDGGVRSSTSADLAKGYDVVIVVAVRAGMAVGSIAERAAAALAQELAELREGGAQVEVVTPDAASLDAFGFNMMDPSRRPGAAKAGYAQGQARAEALRDVWAG